ncbi:2-oxoglutarate dehydrogenase E1 component [Aneurinibacillus aneurinilyticus]|uniref:2-oxoglutarate dehydrogenase E1 component n=1 Tax=Aneurinibacillus aneurinilyticus TaxID=1391 RepID=UPI0023F9E6FC|nr:2-oxoglutarate dehydrogenase E1 component [Aneurinibacillus aneurinilyticus]MCI1693364.1 2-oxoglutarate dehydrogenase E1 component [Aneurinibacillus aneurinilyticus]MED0671441.1 2-oxoglutarate dehydrogenase E1 component [Aneurinibacillus aneurinilyticus]
MAHNQTGSNTPWQKFNGPNLGYVHQLYAQYLQDPQTIAQDMRELFDEWGAPPLYEGTEAYPETVQQDVNITEMLRKVVAAAKLADDIRINGHLYAKINSFTNEEANVQPLAPAAYGLSEEDLQAIPAQAVWPEAPARLQTGWDVITHLREVYISSMAYQFMHVNNLEERNWLNRMVETEAIKRTLDNEEQISVLRKLTEVEEFEQFLHRTFVGQKRFSIEGLEMLVPMVDEMIRQSARDGIKHVLIGMAHRGRLSVLAHILGKPYEKIFSEFHHSPNKDLIPSEGSTGMNYGWTGDVKYHLGADREMTGEDSARLRLTLAHNPSHLEFVNPVVEGYTRAAQEDRQVAGPPKLDFTKAYAISIHGDAAFPGEGVVAETLNLSRLRGYRTGGTIHIIANNQIGFTTGSEDSRSTRYASDLAKGYEIPIVHVNADDPTACLQAIHLAYEYRKTFKKDFLIDLIGYRRYGHNEMDDPTTTQPLLYAKVAEHPRVAALYANMLRQSGILDEKAEKEIKQLVQDRLKKAYEKMKNLEKETEAPFPVKENKDEAYAETRVPAAKLTEINKELLHWPEGFSVYPKLEKILKRREEALESSIDWALAETLAFATILTDGTPIRVTGQDTERGTFAQRNLVLHDYKTGKGYIPLQHLSGARASFAVYNSPLSEAGVLGFEYGYDVLAKKTLVLWEAQFGDFANAAQVIIDTFIASGRAKWGQSSNLVLLLPHGYEGQGPEHSSARLERFLQLSAEQNWTIANLTSAAQYFHLLRCQAARLGTENARPLVLMTPKSLLRNPRAASRLKEFSEGAFRPLLEQPGLEEHPKTAERLILCSGKVAIDLETEWESLQLTDQRVHIARVEQLYPFPERELRKLLEQCKQLREVIWVQEEPKNMGAWSYMEPRLKALVQVPVRYIGRPYRSSPAEGLPDVHKIEQQRIVKQALLIAEPKTVKAGGHTHE